MSKCDHDYVVNHQCADCKSKVIRPTVSSEQVMMANEVLVRKRGMTPTARKFMRSTSAVKRAVKQVMMATDETEKRINELKALIATGHASNDVYVQLGELRERLEYLSQLK